jgi:hypothetical protein
MEHLVESHLGGYYISDLDPEIITAYCESCGDSDWILLSWEKGNMMESLINFFSELKYTADSIENDRKAGITKPEAIQNILYEYSEIDKNIIEILYEYKYISEEEYRQLLKSNLQAQKSQINLVCEVYPKEVRKVFKKQRNKNRWDS